MYYFSFFLVIFVLVLVVLFVCLFLINELLCVLFMCFAVWICLVFFWNCFYKLLFLSLKCLFLLALLGFFIDIFVFNLFCCCCFFLIYYFWSIFSCLLVCYFFYFSDFSILFVIFPSYFCFGLSCVFCVLLFH